MSLDYAIASAIGFGLALILFAGLREHLEFSAISKSLRGVSITLITASLLSLAFMGFSGVDGGLKRLFDLE
jgi:electron transport complex protein RnfA